MIKYILNDKITYSLNEIRNWFGNISLPVEITDDVLTNLGITKEEISPVEPTFEENKAQKLKNIITYYDSIISSTKSGYSNSEIETWDIQRIGATDILSDNTTSTEAQFVINLAQKRSDTSGTTITAQELATKINNNVAIAQAVSVAALGKQQGQYDIATNATTQDELDNIILSFDMDTLS